MANMRDVETDLRMFLMDDRRRLHEDKMEALMGIFEKHLGKEDEVQKFNYKDLVQMISEAKSISANSPVETRVSGELIDFPELRHLFVMEAVLMYLNRHSLLRKEIVIDYTKRR